MHAVRLIWSGFGTNLDHESGRCYLVPCSLFPVLCLTMDRMDYFLFKTEPDVYSFDDFLRDKETNWDGVTNPTAVKYLREMKAGTKWIFYHTGDERTAVGTGTVISVDPSDPKVPIVKVKAGKRIKTPKTLAEIKADKVLKEMVLAKQSRLSVSPATAAQFKRLMKLAETKV